MTTPDSTPSMTDTDGLLGQMAFRRGWATLEQLDACWAEIERARAVGEEELPLIEVLLRRGHVTAEQADDLRRLHGETARLPGPDWETARREDVLFGERTVRQGVVTQDRLEASLGMQDRFRRRGMILRLEEILDPKSPSGSSTGGGRSPSGGDKTLLTCPRCGRNYGVRNYREGSTVFCPRCSMRLEPPTHAETLDATPTDPSSTDTAPDPLGPTVPTEGQDDSDGIPFGRYRLLRELGRGAMGVVYEAWDPDLERVVALKRLLMRGRSSGSVGEEISRLRREAKAAANLNHPGIVSVYDVGEVDGQPFFTMQHVEGWTLDEALATTSRDSDAASRRQMPTRRMAELLRDIAEGGRRRLTPRRAVELLRDVAEAVGAAHARGVVHRDLKPTNILVDESGQVHVADFGLAKRARGQEEEGSGVLLGTPRYMSPEQAAGRLGDVGPASDVFSLATMLYEVVTGRPPFREEKLSDLLRAIRDRAPERPHRALHRARSSGTAGTTTLFERVDRELEAVILKGLAKDPSRRYADARDLADDLSRFLRAEPVLAQPPGRLAGLLRRAGRHKAALAFGFLAVALAVVLGFDMWSRYQDRRGAIHEGLVRARAYRMDRRTELALHAYEGVLRLDEGNLEARSGAEWARGELAAIRNEAPVDAGPALRWMAVFQRAVAAKGRADRRASEGGAGAEVVEAYGEARRLYEEALAAARSAGATEDPPSRALLGDARFDLACIHAVLAGAGEDPAYHAGQAFENLRALHGQGELRADRLQGEPQLRALRDDPRWAALIEGR